MPEHTPQRVEVRIVIADGGGLSTSDLSRFPFTRVRRPIYPLDKDMSFEPEMDG